MGRIEAPPHPPEPSWLELWREHVEAWAPGRQWIPRAVLLLYFTWVGVRHLRDPLYGSLFAGINLGIHEAGHLVFGFLGEWLMVAGGTILQCAAPIVATWLLLRQGDWFGLPVGGFWEATNLYNVATYMADARAQELPLVTIGGGEPAVAHDWTYLLESVGLLEHDERLAGLVRVAAFLLLWGSILLGAWMCRLIARAKASA
ncbi:MAG: hypothetical protein KA072_10950 [Thermoanaerobaculaceae bacterium]|nr:hypothetical protein [Thermoanaerobaculaceae bacterium]MDI9620718.1 hypothetical protein [Acidobacteriota bacterium]HPW55829.1 hypothetical protein [Thermoanaerobaculaceae bacterium]